MIALLVLIVGLPLRPPALFDACVAGHAKLKAYTVHIDVSGYASGKSTRVQYDLSVSGSDALLRIREPALGPLDRSDRTFMIRGNRLTAYDALADERLRRNLKGHASIEQRFADQLGQLDPAFEILLNPNSMQKFFGSFRGFQDWRTSHNGSTVTIERYSKGSATLFRFTGSPPRIQEVRISTKGKALHWNFEFRPGATIALNIPADARPVYTFTERKLPPKYLSVAAKSVVQRMLKAYGALQYGTIQVDSDEEGRSTLHLAGKRIREDHPHFVWSYDGSTLFAKNGATLQFYRGKTIRVILSEYVTKVGGEVDPITMSLLAHRVPYSDLFPSEATVRLQGNLGNAADIIEVASPNLKVSLFIRKDNHLLDSMESETRDRSGKVQTRSMRKFRYSHLGAASDPQSFELESGSLKVQPLPKIKMLGDSD